MQTTKTSKLFYKQMSEKYRTIFPLKHLFYPDCRTIIPEMNLQDGFRLLDVGCGNGTLLFTIANIIKRFEFKGIDVSESIIKRCQKRNKFSQIEFLVSSPENMPFENDYFDIITCTNTVGFFSQRVRSIDSIYRVLKPGGQFYLLEGIRNNNWKQKFDKMLRQTKFIQPGKKYLTRSSMLSKSYLVIATK